MFQDDGVQHHAWVLVLTLTLLVLWIAKNAVGLWLYPVMHIPILSCYIDDDNNDCLLLSAVTED